MAWNSNLDPQSPAYQIAADQSRRETIDKMCRLSVVRVLGTDGGLKIRDLWLLWFVILCGLPTVQQAAIGDCLSSDRLASKRCDRS